MEKTFNSKKEIENALRKSITENPKQAIKAMLRIFEYQTDDEKRQGSVYVDNGVGFAGTDSQILISFCDFYQKHGYLSEKQLSILKKKIGKYAGQLTRHAIEKGLYVKEGKVWVIAKMKGGNESTTPKDDRETYSLSFWGKNGEYKHHDGLSEEEAKNYYLKYVNHGDVDVTYKTYDGYTKEVNPSCFFDEE